MINVNQVINLSWCLFGHNLLAPLMCCSRAISRFKRYSVTKKTSTFSRTIFATCRFQSYCESRSSITSGEMWGGVCSIIGYEVWNSVEFQTSSSISDSDIRFWQRLSSLSLFQSADGKMRCCLHRWLIPPFFVFGLGSWSIYGLADRKTIWVERLYVM